MKQINCWFLFLHICWHFSNAFTDVLLKYEAKQCTKTSLVSANSIGSISSTVMSAGGKEWRLWDRNNSLFFGTRSLVS